MKNNNNKSSKPIQATIIIGVGLIVYFAFTMIIWFSSGISLYLFTSIFMGGISIINLWHFALGLFVDLAVMGIIGWFVAKTKISDFLKAVLLTIPLSYFSAGLMFS